MTFYTYEDNIQLHKIAKCNKKTKKPRIREGYVTIKGDKKG